MSNFNLKFLESASNLQPLIKKSLGREPSMKIAREIAVCIQHGRLFYEAAASSPIEIKPLQMFYGMVNFAKALIIARNLRALDTLPQSHGLRDISAKNSRLEALRVKIENRGTFQEFNNAVSSLNRISYCDVTTPVFKIIPTSTSDEILGKELSIKEILSRIPGLEDLYKQTFNEEPNTSSFLINLLDNYGHCELRIDDSELFIDRTSLRRIVMRWRERYPFLQKWCLESATHAWGNSVIIFSNIDKTFIIDEFSDDHLKESDRDFQTRHDYRRDASVKRNDFTSILAPPLGSSSVAHMVAPFEGTYLSDFSLYYLGMFLLSSVVRYRPQTWGHAISRSVTEENAADDRAVALIESFMGNAGSFPGMIAEAIYIPV